MQIGIHTHDDGGVGTRDVVAGGASGATQVQGTINGYGERVGNCDLCTVIPDLQLKMGYRCLADDGLARLAELSHFVDETANMAPNPRLPFVGSSAFAHKGGIHVAAMLKVEASYQHIDPTLARTHKRVPGERAIGSRRPAVQGPRVRPRRHPRGRAACDDRGQRARESRFYFEGAEASVELRTSAWMQPDYRPPFELIDFMTVVEHREGRGILAEATVKVRVGDEIMHTAAEGNGPVNAMDQALRKALVPHFPTWPPSNWWITRCVFSTAMQPPRPITRVMIQTRNGHTLASTVGVANIIESSWQALADSMEYALLTT